MKECPRCKITFHLNDRSHCLYCDTLLTSVDEDQTRLKDKVDVGMLGIAVEPVLQQVVHEHGIEAHTRLQFIIASYFRTRTFHFMYAFSRNNFKMGPTFDRLLIQPFHMASLLLLPWMFVNILDSVLCRFLYIKYCPKCGWKFYKIELSGEHDHLECEYNREYREVVQAILDGSIIYEEATFKRLGLMKRNAGRKSAYWDLCARKEFFSSVLDVTCIWFSICLWILLVVALTFPSIITGVYMLET